MDTVLLSNLMTAAGALIGVALGGFMSGRESKKQLDENRRVSEREAVEKFVAASNEAHTRLTVQTTDLVTPW